MRVYITCPISHSKNRLNLLPEIKAIVEEKGITSFVSKLEENLKKYSIEIINN